MLEGALIYPYDGYKYLYICFVIQKKEKRRLLHEATMKHQHMYRMAMIGKG